MLDVPLLVILLICELLGVVAAESYPPKLAGGTAEYCYNNVGDMVADMDVTENTFYSAVNRHYTTEPAVDSTMTGTSVELSDADLNETEAFLRKAILSMSTPRRALDGGAGIGRLTERILAKHFDKIDVIELVPLYIEKLKEKMQPYAGVLDHVVQSGLQDATLPVGEKYDLIVLNWVIQYLTDDHVVELFQKCRNALSERGVIFVKENMPEGNWFATLDPPAIHRSLEHYVHLFRRSKLFVHRRTKQQEWSEYLIPVGMFILRGTKMEKKGVY